MRVFGAFAAWLVVAGSAFAQGLPSEPVSMAAWHEGDVCDTRMLAIPSQGGVVEQDFEVR